MGLMWNTRRHRIIKQIRHNPFLNPLSGFVDRSAMASLRRCLILYKSSHHLSLWSFKPMRVLWVESSSFSSMISSACQHYLCFHLSFDSWIFLSQTQTHSVILHLWQQHFISCPHTALFKPIFSIFTFRTFANRFIIKDSSRSSSSSKSSIGIPKGSMMLQHLEPSSLGSILYQAGVSITELLWVFAANSSKLLPSPDNYLQPKVAYGKVTHPFLQQLPSSDWFNGTKGCPLSPGGNKLMYIMLQSWGETTSLISFFLCLILLPLLPFSW